MKKELIDYVLHGTIGIVNESVWMTGPVFVQWLNHFKKYAKASLTEKFLLIVDGRSSHKYLDALIFAKEHGIVLTTPMYATTAVIRCVIFRSAANIFRPKNGLKLIWEGR